MRIALVDDSEIERGILLSLITDYGCEKQILFESDCFDSGDAFLSSFSSDKYDIVFMDIFMNGMSGVETASKMRQIDNHVILIFLTASADYMPDAFRVHAFHYILKPYQKDAIFACLNDASLHLPASETFISFSVNAIEVRIFASQIVCIVADSHYTWITDRNGQKYHPCAAFGTFSKQLLSDRHFLLVSEVSCATWMILNAFLLAAVFFQTDRLFQLHCAMPSVLNKPGVTTVFQRHEIKLWKFDFCFSFINFAFRSYYIDFFA